MINYDNGNLIDMAQARVHWHAFILSCCAMKTLLRY